jgi:transcriptional regulator
VTYVTGNRESASRHRRLDLSSADVGPASILGGRSVGRGFRPVPNPSAEEIDVFIQPWDATLEPAEWQAWLASTDHFGVLAVNNVDPTQAPWVLPTHFTLAELELLMHLARPNPAWPSLEAAVQVRLAVIGDYAFIPNYWRAKIDGPEEEGVPTSYYSAVQFVCRPTVVDDPAAKAGILAAQLAAFQPEGRHAQVAVDAEPYGRLLPGIRGIRLAVTRVEAKFKYDDHKTIEHRERVIDHLEQRAHGLDTGAAAQQRRRLAAIGDWQAHRDRH